MCGKYGTKTLLFVRCYCLREVSHFIQTVLVQRELKKRPEIRHIEKEMQCLDTLVSIYLDGNRHINTSEWN